MAIIPKLVPVILLATSPYVIAGDLSIYVGLSSETLTRSISPSAGVPSLQFSIDANFESDFFSGVNLSYGKSVEAPKRNRQFDVYAGYFSRISDKVALEYSIVYYGFYGDFQQSWNYFELRNDVHLSKAFSINVAYSNNYYGRNKDSLYSGLNWQPKIADETFAFFSFGRTKLSNAFYTIRIKNYSAGVSTSFGNFDIKLGYYYVDNSVEFIHGEGTAGSRIAFEVNYALF